MKKCEVGEDSISTSAQTALSTKTTQAQFFHILRHLLNDFSAGKPQYSSHVRTVCSGDSVAPWATMNCDHILELDFHYLSSWCQVGSCPLLSQCPCSGPSGACALCLEVLGTNCWIFSPRLYERNRGRQGLPTNVCASSHVSHSLLAWRGRFPDLKHGRYQATNFIH